MHKSKRIACKKFKNRSMEKHKFEGLYLFLISILIISIVAGPSISLLNILFIITIFLINYKVSEIKIEKKIFIIFTIHIICLSNL